MKITVNERYVVEATAPSKPELPSHKDAIEWIDIAADVSDWGSDLEDDEVDEYTYDTETWFFKHEKGCDYYISAVGSIAEIGDFRDNDVESRFEEECDHQYVLETVAGPGKIDMNEVRRLLPQAVKDYPSDKYGYMMYRVSAAK